MKEIKLSPNIGTHDVEYRVKQANKFLEEGEQVKVTLSYKGREVVHWDIGVQTITSFVSQCLATSTPIKTLNGRRKSIQTILNPIKKTKNNGKSKGGKK